MDCERVARDEILERYLLGRLTEEDRELFEEHYFECARCFAALKTLRTIGGELRRERVDIPAERARPFLPWIAAAGLAAVVVLVFGALLWMRAPSGTPELAQHEPPASRELPDAPPRVPESTTVTQPSVEQLARVEPPRYEALTLRGVPDEATAMFQRGMERYRTADYQAAIPELREAAALDPEAVHVRFFLGISYLMSGQDTFAIEQLRAAIALGDSAYLEDAHWYLAKAFLRRKSIAAGKTELTKLVELRGARATEAQRLLAELEKLQNRSQ